MDHETRLLMTDIADQAAHKAVRETLLTLGIDASDPIEAQRDMATLRELRDLTNSDEFKKDLLHLRRWRRTMDNVEAKGLIAGLGMLIFGSFAMILYAFKIKIGSI